jgi:hypothetical protein
MVAQVLAGASDPVKNARRNGAGTLSQKLTLTRHTLSHKGSWVQVRVPRTL